MDSYSTPPSTASALSAYQTILLLRTPGNTELANWVKNGGRLITEWNAAQWSVLLLPFLRPLLFPSFFHFLFFHLLSSFPVFLPLLSPSFSPSRSQQRADRGAGRWTR